MNCSLLSVLADQARDLAQQAERERLDLKRERLASEQREREAAMEATIAARNATFAELDAELMAARAETDRARQALRTEIVRVEWRDRRPEVIDPTARGCSVGSQGKPGTYGPYHVQLDWHVSR